MSKQDDNRANNRPERIPLHKQKILGYPERPGYVRYWANDIEDEIRQMKLAGWAPVHADNNDLSHDGLSHVESGTGSVVRRVVNKAGGVKGVNIYGILMEIPQEYYDADFLDKMQQIDEAERTYDKTGEHAKKDRYGGIKRMRGI